MGARRTARRFAIGGMATLATVALVSLLSMTTTAAPARSDPGSLDRTFGGDGKVITSFGSRDAGIRAIVVQPDGKLVAGGWTGVRNRDEAFGLARYNTDGSLDTTFGDGGKVTTDFPGAGGVEALAVQADGKIVAGGHGALARYNLDGSPDPAFGGGDGFVAIDAYDLGMQPGGRIVVNTGDGIARYDSDGTPDPTFGGGGLVEPAPLDMAVQSDGRVVSLTPALYRYTVDGALDTSFGDGGRADIHLFGGGDFYSVAVGPDGTIVIGGSYFLCGGGIACDYGYLLLPVTSDGIQIGQFGGNQSLMEHVAQVAVQVDGKIVASGISSDDRIGLARHDAEGGFDRSFAGGARFVRFNRHASRLGALALDAEGDVIVAGRAAGRAHWKFAIARYVGSQG